MPRCTRCGGSFVWQTDLDGRRVVCLACGCEPGVAAAAAAMGKGAAAMTSEPQQSPAAGGAVERCVWCRQMVEAWHMTEHFQICPVRQQSKQANWPAAIAALPPPTPDAPCPQCGPGKAGAEIAEQALAAARAVLPEPPTPDAAALRVALSDWALDEWLTLARALNRVREMAQRLSDEVLGRTDCTDDTVVDTENMAQLRAALAAVPQHLIEALAAATPPAAATSEEPQ